MNKTKHGTKIEWTHFPGYKGETWNPVSGCSKISEGCEHCYAERLFPKVYSKDRIPIADTIGQHTSSSTIDTPTSRPRCFTDVKCHENRVNQPLHWAKPRAIFICSMGDLFHEKVPFEFIDKVFLTMASSSASIIGGPYGHIFLILTKRPERMLEYYQREEHRTGYHNFHGLMKEPGVPGIWLGTTVENNDCLHRIDILRKIPAAHKFVSFEPLLSGIPDVDLTGIDWVICGGESGPGARPMLWEWPACLLDQCERAGIPFFMKQMSQHGGFDRHDIPSLLNVKEFPDVQ